MKIKSRILTGILAGLIAVSTLTSNIAAFADDIKTNDFKRDDWHTWYEDVKKDDYDTWRSDYGPYYGIDSSGKTGNNYTERGYWAYDAEGVKLNDDMGKTSDALNNYNKYTHINAWNKDVVNKWIDTLGVNKDDLVYTNEKFDCFNSYRYIANWQSSGDNLQEYGMFPYYSKPANKGYDDATLQNYTLPFALAKMLVASGYCTELPAKADDLDSSEEVARTYINPACMLLGIYLYSGDSITDTNLLDDPRKWKSFLKNIYGDDIGLTFTTFAATGGTSYTKYGDDKKKEEVKAALDNGEYVIVRYGSGQANYISWRTACDDKNKSTDDMKRIVSQGHYLLLTGYTKTEKGIQFTCDDPLSPIVNFEDLYDWKYVTSYTSFTIDTENKSRLKFYQELSTQVPWYLKLINKTNKLKEAEVTDKAMETSVKKTYLLGFTVDEEKLKKAITPDAINEAIRTDGPGSDILEDNAAESHKNMSTNINKMLSDANSALSKDGIELRVYAGFRTWKEQEKVYDADSSGNTAKPGASEHNTGLCFDFAQVKGSDVKAGDDFKDTPAFEWLCQNAWKYGFIYRYPEDGDAQDTTGYKCKPEHWRYITPEWSEKYIAYTHDDLQDAVKDGASVSEWIRKNPDYTFYLDMTYNGKVYEDFYNDVVSEEYDIGEITETPDTDEEEDTESKEYNDKAIRRIYFFMTHPIKALGNLIAGLLQNVHNAMAVGNIVNIFDLSWFITWLQSSGVLAYYLAITGIIVSFSLAVRMIKYLTGSIATIQRILIDSGKVILISTVPVVILLVLNFVISQITNAVTAKMLGPVSIVEISTLQSYEKTQEEKKEDDSTSEVTTYEVLTNTKLQEQIFRESFDNVEEIYNFSEVEMPTGTMSIRDLYDEVSYDTILGTLVNNANSSKSKKYTGFGTSNAVINKLTAKSIDSKKINPQPNRLSYYNYQCFVPVNYERYDESVFYYFYDWIKYQYLAYWGKGGRDQKGSTLTLIAKAFNYPRQNYSVALPAWGQSEEDESSSLDNSKESFEEYVSRMTNLEENYLSNAYSGIYVMYTDNKYVYTSPSTVNGDTLYKDYSVKDLFGLSYMFNMTSSNANHAAKVNGTYTGRNNLEEWAKINYVNYVNGYPNFSTFCSWNKAKRAKFFAVSPLSNIVLGEHWDTYNKSTDLHIKNGGNSYSTYKFTPTYMYENYPKYFTDTKGNPLKITSNTTFKKGMRLPYRLYASESLLTKHSYTTNSQRTIQMNPMPLERTLMKLNETIYDDLRIALDYMPGDTCDDQLIFVAALIATSDFNRVFGSIGEQVQPLGVTHNSIDMDKIERITYASTIDDVLSNTATIYMIYDGKGGLVVCLFVIFAEGLLILCILLRTILTALIFLASASAGISYMISSPDELKNIVKSIAVQIGGLILSHAILVSGILLAMARVASFNNAGGRVLASVIICLVYLVVATLSGALCFAMVKDLKHFGQGTIRGWISSIRDLVTAEKNKINSDEIRTKLNNFKMRQTVQDEEVSKENRRIYKRKFHQKRITAQHTMEPRDNSEDSSEDRSKSEDEQTKQRKRQRRNKNNKNT